MFVPLTWKDRKGVEHFTSFDKAVLHLARLKNEGIALDKYDLFFEKFLPTLETRSSDAPCTKAFRAALVKVLTTTLIYYIPGQREYSVALSALAGMYSVYGNEVIPKDDMLYLRSKAADTLNHDDTKVVAGAKEFLVATHSGAHNEIKCRTVSITDRDTQNAHEGGAHDFEAYYGALQGILKAIRSAATFTAFMQEARTIQSRDRLLTTIIIEAIEGKVPSIVSARKTFTALMLQEIKSPSNLENLDLALHLCTHYMRKFGQLSSAKLVELRAHVSKYTTGHTSLAQYKGIEAFERYIRGR